MRRESSWQVIPSRELVPGDIVRVRPGDIIPADVKLLTGALTVDQSALTGESKDADKASGDVLSSGSVVRRGEGNGVVTLTGARTSLGRTTELVQRARPKLHIEAVVAKVVRWLFVILAALLGSVVVLSLIRRVPLVEMVPLMLVLLMSAVPVALPVMFTVSMSIGSKELAKRGVLVTRLSPAEDAATMDVLCVDKTGTITMNQLAVTGVIPLGTRRNPTSSSPARSRPGKPTKTQSISRSSGRRRSVTSSTASRRSRPSPSRLSTRRTGGRKPSSNRTGSGCA